MQYILVPLSSKDMEHLEQSASSQGLSPEQYILRLIREDHANTGDRHDASEDPDTIEEHLAKFSKKGAKPGAKSHRNDADGY